MEYTGEFAERQKIVWFWLSEIGSISPSIFHRLEKAFKDIRDIMNTDIDEIISISGVSYKIAKDICDHKSTYFKSEEKYLKLPEEGIQLILHTSEAFPDGLREIPEPPFLIYVKGKLPDVEKPSAAIVGSRQCTAYGKNYTKTFSAELAERGCHIISGLAYGIDGAAHKSALDAGGRTSAVMGCGIDECYPKEHFKIYDRILENDGSIISEYPPGTPALGWHFPVRNRLISGLSDIVMVMEARKKSGTQNTVNYALDQGKDIFVLPGRLNDPLSEGCIQMIRDGAQVLTGMNQLEEIFTSKHKRLAPKASRKAKPFMLDKVDKQVYSAFSCEEMSLDRLLERVTLSPAEVHKALIRLELNGYIIRSSNGRYMLCGGSSGL